MVTAKERMVKSGLNPSEETRDRNTKKRFLRVLRASVVNASYLRREIDAAGGLPV